MQTIRKIINDCMTCKDGSNHAFRRTLVGDCHAALLFTPDATLYQVLVDNGWDGLEFASQSFDPQFLGEDLQQLLANKNYSTAAAQQLSKSPNNVNSPLGTGVPRSASQGAGLNNNLRHSINLPVSPVSAIVGDTGRKNWANSPAPLPDFGGLRLGSSYTDAPPQLRHSLSMTRKDSLPKLSRENLHTTPRSDSEFSSPGRLSKSKRIKTLH